MRDCAACCSGFSFFSAKRDPNPYSGFGSLFVPALRSGSVQTRDHRHQKRDILSDAPFLVHWGNPNTNRAASSHGAGLGVDWLFPPKNFSEADQTAPTARHQKRGVLSEAPLLVPVTGLEPVRCCQQGILSPWCLPIPPHRQLTRLLYHLKKSVSSERRGRGPRKGCAAQK